MVRSSRRSRARCLSSTRGFGTSPAQVRWRAGSDAVYIAGIGTGHDANAYVVGVLRAAGYEVASGPTIPEDLAGIGQLWWIDWNNRPAAEDIPRLEDFINDGGGLYLTGERPCCELLNQRVEEIVNQVVLDGPIQVGGFGDPFDQYGTVATNPDAVGGVSTTPHEVPGIRVAAPGGMAGLSGANVLALTPAGVPIAGIWDAEHLTGDGRLAVLMDINWLDSGARGPLANELVENLALYLSNLQDPPEPPPVVASVPDQDTSTADEDGDRPPTGPGVD